MKAATNAKEREAETPRIRHIDDYVPYREARAKQFQFTRKVAEVREQIQAIYDGMNMLAMQRQSAIDPVEQAAEKLLRGDPLNDVNEELAMLRKRSETLRQALEILERAAKRAAEIAEKELEAAAVQIAAQYAPKLMELEHAAMLALVAYGQAEEAKLEFVEQIRNQTGLPMRGGNPLWLAGGLNVSPPFLNPHAPENRLLYRLRHAIQAGTLDEAEVPRHWLQRPAAPADASMVPVKLLVRFNSNQPGDICGLPPNAAAALIAAGQAQRIDASGTVQELAPLPAPARQKGGLRAVRFLQDYVAAISGYNAGEIAGFPSEEAAELIRRRIAEPYNS